jgi:hypothetical protein
MLKKELVRLTIRVSPEIRKALRLRAAHRDVCLADLLREFIAEGLARRRPEESACAQC